MKRFYQKGHCRQHVGAVIALPGTVAVIGPALLVAGSGPRFAWGLQDLAAALVALVGVALIAGGLVLVTWTVRLFVHLGQGTLAPWEPTQRLVTAGPYAHVRNPMITGVTAVLLGESVLAGTPSLLIYVLVMVAVNHAYFVLVEEPGLAKRFGAEYRRYERAVPRWIPRQPPYSTAE